MRQAILATAHDLITRRASAAPLSLEEVAACAGIKLHHLRAYYTSADAIRDALTKGGDRDALD